MSSHGQPLVKLGDFGTATTQSRKGIDEARKIVGCLTTPLYAAPEMLMAGIDGKAVSLYAVPFPQYFDFSKPKITLAADIYSLGLILTEIAGTQHPEYPPPRLPGNNMVLNMCILYSKRPHILRVSRQRFTPTFDFIQLLAELTKFNPLERSSILDLKQKPLLLKHHANFKI